MWLLCLDGPTLVHRHTVLGRPELVGLDAISSLVIENPAIDPKDIADGGGWGSSRTSVQLCDSFLDMAPCSPELSGVAGSGVDAGRVFTVEMVSDGSRG